jgi:serine/threonine protein kinase
MCPSRAAAADGADLRVGQPEGPQDTSLSLSELCADGEPFAHTEAAAVLAPVLRELAAVHRREHSHGNLSLATISIRVQQPAAGAVLHTVHLAPSAGEAAQNAHQPLRCARCMPPEDKCVSGASSLAGDIWTVGVIALQMLLGRQCRFAESGECCGGLVDRCSGELPILPVGLSLECIDFLVDCLSQDPAHRPSASELLGHAFLLPFAPASSSAATCSSESQACAQEDLDALHPLMHVLLIADDVRTKPAPCRPRGVPRLTAPLWTGVCLETSTHTRRTCSCKQRDVGASHEPARAPDSMPQHAEANQGSAALPASRSAGDSRPDCATDGKSTSAQESSLQWETAAQLQHVGWAPPGQAVGDSRITPQPHQLAPRPLKRKSCRVPTITTNPQAVKLMSPAAVTAHALLPGAWRAALQDEATDPQPMSGRKSKCAKTVKMVKTHFVTHMSPQKQAAELAKVESSALTCIAAHGYHSWAHEVFGPAVGGAGFARLPSSPSSSPEQIPMPFPTGLLPPLQI